ncbi:MAG: hypothetical protein ACO3JL_02050 [Myxococcota bacterium]
MALLGALAIYVRWSHGLEYDGDMANSIRLGDLLLKASVVSPQQVQEALAQQQKWGGKLGAILVRMGALSEDLLVKALARQLNMPRADLRSLDVAPPLRSRIDRSFCEQHGVVPVRYDSERRVLIVAVSDPLNIVVLDELNRLVNIKLEPQLAGETQILEAIRAVYGEGLTSTSVGGESSIKLLNNQNSTLVKRRDEIVPGRRDTAALPSDLDPALPPRQRPVATEPPVPAAPAPTTVTGDRLAELEKLASRQARALRATLELLVEKGVIAQEEYQRALRRGR